MGVKKVKRNMLREMSTWFCMRARCIQKNTRVRVKKEVISLPFYPSTLFLNPISYL